jgi:hypothetical protein
MFGESIVEPELNTCFELFLCLVHQWNLSVMGVNIHRAKTVDEADK